MVKLKRFGWTLFIALFLFAIVSPQEVLADNQIESIHIKAIIQEDGSVIIRDHRIFYAEEGTEHYISLDNLGESVLLDFTVYDEKGNPLEDVGEWDVYASFSDKAGKYGINHAGSGIELCFGLGEYGRREFVIEYKLSNFIFNLSDGHQGFYWQFINPNMDPIKNIQIEVQTDVLFEFLYPETRFWAFGHEGGITEITSDSMTMETGDSFLQSDYVVLLGIFEGSPFLTSYQLDETSDQLIERAMGGASLDGHDYEDFIDDKINGPDEIPNDVVKNNSFEVFGGIFRMFFSFIPFLLILIGVSKVTKGAKSNPGKFKSTVKDEYYREVPYDNHFINTHYFTNSQVSDWISAFILKWVSEGRLEDQVEEVGLIFKRDKLALKINPNSQRPGNEMESKLWDMTIEAAGRDQILSEKEFNSYVKRNINEFNNWTNSIESSSEIAMIEEGYLEEFTRKVFKIFNRRELIISDKGQALGDNIIGFKNYLKDFSLVGEREVSHVKLWQELMVWAAYMGIAEEVYQQLKIVNPQIEYQMPYSPQTVIMTHHFARAIQSTQTSANTSSTSSSFSGGGGSSFGGGGGGSFGGGSGGGTR